MCERTFSAVNDDVVLNELPTLDKIVTNAEKSHVGLQVVYVQ